MIDPTTFLRRSLQLDGVASGLTGLLLLAGKTMHIGRMAASGSRRQGPTTRTSILPLPGIIGSRLGQMARGEPGAAPLPVRLRGGDPATGSALLGARHPSVHPRPPESTGPLPGAPAMGRRVPDGVGRGQGARDRDHDPAAARGDRLSTHTPPGSGGFGSIASRTSTGSDAGTCPVDDRQRETALALSAKRDSKPVWSTRQATPP